MDGWLSLLVGIALSAACGFRVFVPLLVMSLASMEGHLALAPGFEWIATPEALSAFAIATVCELFSYYIPWWDNLMDSISSPAAVAAGTITTASVLTDTSPFMQWTLAVIAGGGAAGMVQAGTVLVRGASTFSTGGLGNPLVATAEAAASTITSLVALIAPLVAIITVAVLVILTARKLRQKGSALIGPERRLPM